MFKPLSDVDVVVLAGGLGTRLQPVLEGKPKILAPIGNGQTYLDFLLKWLSGQGAKRVIFALGHKAEMVVEALAGKPHGLDIVFSVEEQLLGTAGALRLAAQYVTTSPVLVMNGDSWVDGDLNAFIEHHKARRSALSFLCVTMPDTSRFGTIETGADGAVTGYREKDPARVPGTISAGMYLFNRMALNDLIETDGPSLEKDFFAHRLELKPQAFVVSGAFIDIGTPESLAQAPFVLK